MDGQATRSFFSFLLLLFFSTDQTFWWGVHGVYSLRMGVADGSDTARLLGEDQDDQEENGAGGEEQSQHWCGCHGQGSA